jgi:hypothetical protein
VAVELPRGVNASLFGWNARYAIRELEFRGLLPPSSPNQLVSGGELIGILARADEYQQQSRPRLSPAAPAASNNVARSPETPDQPSPLPGVELASRALDGLFLLQDVPTTAPTGARFVVAAVAGKVSVRLAEGDAFVPATVGMELTEATEISTGCAPPLRSKARATRRCCSSSSPARRCGRRRPPTA